MNKLTTNKTLKAAVPLAMLAVVMSGSAFAGPPKKASISVYNKCEVKTHDDYYNRVPPQLVITSKIKDASDDSGGVTPDLGYISVYPEQKGMKEKGTRGPNTFEPLGSGVSQGAVMGKNVTTIYLCNQDPELRPDANVLNAEIVVELNNSRKGVYTSKCDDNPHTYCEEYNEVTKQMEQVYCEEKDESIVKVKPGICL